MKIFAVTQKGPHKPENEDRIVVNKTILSGGSLSDEINNGFVAIADGVGGNNAGAVASHYLAYNLGLRGTNKDSLAEINKDLIALSKSDSALGGMATTLALVELNDDSILIKHVGNTRVFSLTNGKYLKQLTKDDTTLEYLISTGKITEEDAASFDRKNEITACFGANDEKLLSIKEIQLSNTDDPIIITSDGIHDYLSIDDIEETLTQDDNIIDNIKCLIDLCRENGSLDDASILIGVK